MPAEVVSAWVLFLDIYGFSAQIQEDEAACFRRLNSASIEIRKQSLRAGYFPFILSDSIFVVAHAQRQRSLSLDFLQFVRDIQDELIDRQFLPRGGLAAGRVHLSDRVAVGIPIVRAVRTEQEIDVPCVFLPLREAPGLRLDQKWLKEMPTKDGGLVLGYVIPPKTLRPHSALVDSRLEVSMKEGPRLAAAGLRRLRTYTADW